MATRMATIEARGKIRKRNSLGSMFSTEAVAGKTFMDSG